MARIRDAKRFRLAGLMKKIEEARTSEIGQPVSFDAFKMETSLSVLYTAIDFHPEIPEADKNNLLRKAIFSTVEQGVINEQSLMELLNNIERDYLRSPLLDYILATSLTINYFKRLSSITIDDKDIKFSSHLPNNFNRLPIVEGIERATVIKNPSKFTSVRIQVKARTPAAALDNALNTLDFMRGVWNYRINSYTGMSYQYGINTPKPINNVLLGPVHTLHLLDGSLADGGFWYQHHHSQYDVVFELKNRWDDIRKWNRYVNGRIKNIKYAEDVKILFIKYTNIMDGMSYGVIFNKLWSLLEALTNAQGQYEKVVSRTLFLYNQSDRDLTTVQKICATN